ncbi:MAG: hypothetical protein IIB77_07590 [Proteobacteria bacterium]|nr:hypothetical protein [Pseudomonadota bacterium]
MTRKPATLKRKAKRGGGTVRVLAVKRPPIGVDVAKECLPESPYITQAQLADWLNVAPQDLSADKDMTLEKYAAIGLSMLSRLEARKSESPDIDAGQFLAVMLSVYQSALFDGVYAPTRSNPLYAIDDFLTFHRFGLYPPAWVLNWLAKAFNEYVNSAGEADLSLLLGVKRGKGKTPIFKEANSVSRERYHMQEIAFLMMLGATIAEAAEMVSARQEECGGKCPSADTLAERFSKRGWSKISKLMKLMPSSLSLEDRKKAFLAYPAHTIPLKFR